MAQSTLQAVAKGNAPLPLPSIPPPPPPKRLYTQTHPPVAWCQVMSSQAGGHIRSEEGLCAAHAPVACGVCSDLVVFKHPTRLLWAARPHPRTVLCVARRLALLRVGSKHGPGDEGDMAMHAYGTTGRGWVGAAVASALRGRGGRGACRCMRAGVRGKMQSGPCRLRAGKLAVAPGMGARMGVNGSRSRGIPSA